jgi:hypothetical protein
MNNNHEIIHSTIVTLDIPAFKDSKRGQIEESESRPAPSIEDSLNAVLAGLTHSLLSASPSEQESIKRRIDNIVSLLDRRHW